VLTDQPVMRLKTHFTGTACLSALFVGLIDKAECLLMYRIDWHSSEDIFKENFLTIIENLCENPEISINELSLKSGFSLKSLERTFNKRIGLTPKKFTRIIRF